MRRSPWGAVLVSVIVMVAAAASTYVPWHQVVPLLLPRAEAAWAAARGWAAGRWALDLASVRLPQLTAVPTWALGGIGLALLVAAFATVAARSRRTRPRVLRMARRGEPVPAIARRFGLSQDAVRLLTSPMLDPARSGGRRGNSFRSGAAGSAGRSGHGRGSVRPTR